MSDNDPTYSTNGEKELKAFLRLGGAEIEIRGEPQTVGQQLKELVESLRAGGISTSVSPSKLALREPQEFQVDSEVVEAVYADTPTLVEYFTEICGDAKVSQHEAILLLLKYNETYQSKEKVDTSVLLRAFEQLKRIPIETPKNLSARLSELSEKGLVFYDKSDKSYRLTQRGSKTAAKYTEVHNA